MDKSPIQVAVEVVGGQRALADQIKTSKVFVNQLVHGKRPVPGRLCSLIETATSGAVTRYDLRPDIFGTAPASSEAA